MRTSSLTIDQTAKGRGHKEQTDHRCTDTLLGGSAFGRDNNGKETAKPQAVPIQL